MFRVYSTCVACIALFYYQANAALVRNKWHPETPFKLVDYSTTKDVFFDRVVFLTLDVANYMGLYNTTSKVISTGVLIENNRVLTSYNAVRNLTKTGDMLDKIYVCFILYRRVTLTKTNYTYECDTIACARPVVPMHDDELSESQWHGPNKEYSPLHDLMVLRLDTKLDVWKPEHEDTYEQRHSEDAMKNEIQQRAGPLLTELCTAEEEIKGRLQFVSIGLFSKLDVLKNYRLRLQEYENSENIIVNCEEWLPMSWGYFICIENDEDRFFGFSSGSMLFAERKLFGVGSFTMWREKKGVLVFTDIRPYMENIENTCTANDLV